MIPKKEEEAKKRELNRLEMGSLDRYKEYAKWKAKREEEDE